MEERFERECIVLDVYKELELVSCVFFLFFDDLFFLFGFVFLFLFFCVLVCFWEM